MAAAALFGKRSTRFRHVYGLPAQKENCYDNIRVSANAHDSMFCAVNRSFLAVVLECAGGGGFAVLPLQRTGRIDHNAPKVCGHSAPVMDIKWNPFNDNIIASASDDATVKLWEIPRTGIRSDLTRWSLDLRAHSRRVAYLEWHPTAANILLSAGFDHATVLWNCEIGSPVLVSRCHPDSILSLSWNRDGSLYATTCKDRTARIIDPRSGKAVLSFEPHHGAKTTKIAYLADTKQLFTTGFSQFAQRQYGLWDMRSLGNGAIKMDNVDSASGALFPFYDHDTRMVYLAGKGDGNIRYYELTPSEPFVHYLSEFQSPHPQRGLGVMPKLALDTSKCEIFRFYKLHSNRPYCEPISMIAPRKAETFQEDLYPPTAADRPALSAIEWIGGTNRDPILVNIREPKQAVNSPPMVTARPIQLTRLPSQTLVSPQHANKPITPNGSNHQVNNGSTDVDENSIPQSVRNIRKLVGDHPSVTQSPSGESRFENGHTNGTEKESPGQNFNAPAFVHSNGEGHHLNGHNPNDIGSFNTGNNHPTRLIPGHSEVSIGSSSRGSDSVFERSSRRSEMERPSSPVAATLALKGDDPNNRINGKQVVPLVEQRRSLTEKSESVSQDINRNDFFKAVEPKPEISGNAHKSSGSSEVFPKQADPVNNSVIQNDNVNADDPSGISTSGAFHPVVLHRQPQLPPPSNLPVPTLPPATLQIDKPVSSGYVVQTAVASSPMSPTNRFTSHQQENLVPTSQKVIQKLPQPVLDTQALALTTDYNSGEFPPSSSQYRRGAAGGNAYHPQNHSSRDHHQPASGLVRSPSGRGTRPDILDALQEQLSASSRELRSGFPIANAASPPAMHQTAVYSKGPSPQAAHLAVGPVSGGSRNLSPAERRYRNRTVGADGSQPGLMSIGDFTSPSSASPGMNYSATARVGGLTSMPQHQPHSNQNYLTQPHQRRHPPPVPARGLSGATSGMPPYIQHTANIDVRDDMAPSIMRHNQQMREATSPSGLLRSQTAYFPVDNKNNVNNNTNRSQIRLGDVGQKLGTMPNSNVKNGGNFTMNPNGSIQPLPNGSNLHVDNYSGLPDRGRSLSRPKRDLSAAPAVSSRHGNDQTHHRPQQFYQQPQQAGEEQLETMSEGDLRSFCRRQRDEIRLLKRQADAKDQVIARLENELRHLIHQMQQRYGGAVGSGSVQPMAAVGP